jgi:hypothetical protein
MTNVQVNRKDYNISTSKDSLLVQNLGRTSIDSLKLHVPTRYIKNFDISRLTQSHVVFNSDCELLSKFDKYQLKANGFVLGIQRAKGGKYAVQEQLLIMFSSKVLGGARYYEGLHSDTIRLAYEKINSALIDKGIGFMDSATFLNGTCTDVDIKCDKRDSSNSLSLGKVAKRIINTNGANRTLSQFAPKGKSSFKTGLQLGSRITGTQGSSFYKIYNKPEEMKQAIIHAANHNEDCFFNSIPTIANDSNMSNVWRSEVTMKGKAMLSANGLPNTLGELMQVSGNKLNEVIESNFMKWVKKEIAPLPIPKAVKEGLSSEELVILDCIISGLYTYDIYVDRLKLWNTTRSTMKRKKKRFLELLSIAEGNNTKQQITLVNNPKSDSNIQGNPSSDLSTFCNGILYAANA